MKYPDWSTAKNLGSKISGIADEDGWYFFYVGQSGTTSVGGGVLMYINGQLAIETVQTYGGHNSDIILLKKGDKWSLVKSGSSVTGGIHCNVFYLPFRT